MVTTNTTNTNKNGRTDASLAAVAKKLRYYSESLKRFSYTRTLIILYIYKVVKSHGNQKQAIAGAAHCK